MKSKDRAGAGRSIDMIHGSIWNKLPIFAERVHQNTREIIRRDRNHPSVLMWEPILNETRYPHDFSLEALQITKDEYPYP